MAPASTLVATDVEIRGFGFCLTPTHSHVACNGTPATAVSRVAYVQPGILDCKTRPQSDPNPRPQSKDAGFSAESPERQKLARACAILT